MHSFGFLLVCSSLTLFCLTPPILFLHDVMQRWIYSLTQSLMPSSVATTPPPRAMGHSVLIRASSLPLSLLLLLLASQTLLASPPPAPAPGPCGGHYDCTSTENSLFTHFARLPNISACRACCQEDLRCEFFTFNYQQHSLYPGACFLLTSCSLKRPGASQWVSGARDCPSLPSPDTLARHLQDFLLRTQ